MVKTFGVPQVCPRNRRSAAFSGSRIAHLGHVAGCVAVCRAALTSSALCPGHNAFMTQSGGHRGERASRRSGPLLPLVGYGVGVLVSAAAWLFLVKAAIDFGASARDGEDEAWWFLGLAVLGAILCLLLTLVLIGRALMAAGLISDVKPRRAHRR